ncbi:MAG: pilus assembly protein [Clostridiaceae bacterium]|nr:pilus assembly protein [Clostridiaceae bacterium]
MWKGTGKRSGRATIEYIIIMPVVIACVMAVIMVFECLYQQSAIQALADSTAEGLSMIWGHNPIKEEEIASGAFSRESYDNRQLYWQILPANSDEKRSTARDWVEKQLESIGLLKEVKDRNAEVSVSYHHGFPTSKIVVNITAYYVLPGAAALKFIGLGDVLTIRCRAEAPVYDQKEMINVSDYVIQKVMESKAGEFLKKIASPLKKALKMLK